MGSSYLLLGPERGKRDAFIEDIIATLKKKSSEEPEIHRIYPFDSNVIFELDKAQTGSLFAAAVVMIFFNAESYNAKEGALFDEYLKNPPESTTVIFVSEEINADKITKGISKHFDTKNTHKFYEMFESDKKGWLLEFFRKAKISITKEGVDFLLEMLQNNIADFKQTCQQIVLVYPAGTQLVVEVLEEFLYHSKEENVFSLFDKIISGDFQGALTVLQKICFSGDFATPQLVGGGLLWQIKRLMAWSELSNQNYPVTDIAKQLKVYGKIATAQMQTGVKRYSYQQLNDMVILTTRMDGVLRESRGEIQSILLELYLYFLIVKKGDSENFEKALSFL